MNPFPKVNFGVPPSVLSLRMSVYRGCLSEKLTNAEKKKIDWAVLACCIPGFLDIRGDERIAFHQDGMAILDIRLDFLVRVKHRRGTKQEGDGGSCACGNRDYSTWLLREPSISERTQEFLCRIIANVARSTDSEDVQRFVVGHGG